MEKRQKKVIKPDYISKDDLVILCGHIERGDVHERGYYLEPGYVEVERPLKIVDANIEFNSDWSGRYVVIKCFMQFGCDMDESRCPGDGGQFHFSYERVFPTSTEINPDTGRPMTSAERSERLERHKWLMESSDTYRDICDSGQYHLIPSSVYKGP